MNAIALDDEPPALRIIEEFCKNDGRLNLLKSFTSPAEALKYLRKFPVDILFLDIQMPSKSGIELHKELPEGIIVIFTTAFSEYAIDGFNLNAVDYLLKPYTFDRFQQATQKAKEYYSVQSAKNPENNELLIRADYSLHRIQVKDIQFIEGLDDYLKIHLPNKSIVARMTMKGILEKLPTGNFIRIHRSYIIPRDKIESVRSKSVYVSGTEIPIGTSYQEDFINSFKK